MDDLIKRADAIAIIDRVIKSGLGRYKSLDYIRKYISALPSADAKPRMTEEVREALMRLTMCAREECDMCKYKDKCGFEFQYNISTENMNTILEALLADSESDDLIIKGAKGIQDGLYNITDGEIRYTGENYKI